MNNKVYRLLRNNKEQGPFSADELKANNLKPFDLIWIDGRSTAWSYPIEIAEFKLHIQNEENKAAGIRTEASSRISASVQAAVSVNNTIIKTELPRQKPRYKVSAAWSKIQTVTAPAYGNVIVSDQKKKSSPKIINTNNIQLVNVKSLSWEQAWLDWEHEKNAVVSNTFTTTGTNLPATPSKISQTKTTTPVLEKKFEQSLDTITDKYINNILHNKKKNKSFSFGKASEFVLPSLALIIIFSIAYWFMHNTKAAPVTNATPSVQKQTQLLNTGKENSSNSALKIQPTSQKTSVQTSVINTASNINSSNSDTKKKSTKNYLSNTNISKPEKTKSASNFVTGNTSTKTEVPVIAEVNLKKTNQSTGKQFAPAIINNVSKDDGITSTANSNDLNTAETRPVRRRTNTADGSISQNTKPVLNTQTEKNTKSFTSYITVPEYIPMEDGNGDIKVENTSNIDLDLAVIDVQYYDGSGRYRKGETLYLHNLKAGKTVTIKTATDVNSAYATSKVSLVSSDPNGVYAVGDN